MCRLVIVLGLLLATVQVSPAQVSEPLTNLPLEAIRARATAGDAGAQVELALRYANGRTVMRDDAEAIKWARLSAQQSHTPGQLVLATILEQGRGVPADPVEAARLYRAAATQGSAQGRYRLGRMLLSGYGIQKDLAEAVRLLEAAGEGIAEASFLLGTAYAFGDGVARDEAKAEALYQRAAAAGYDGAQALLGTIAQGKLRATSMATLHRRFVVDAGTISPPDSRRVSAAGLSYFQKFPPATTIDFALRVAGSEHPVVVTMTSNSSPCSMLQGHLINWMYDEIRPRDPSSDTAVIDMRLTTAETPAAMRARLESFAATFSLKEYNGASFGESRTPLTALYLPDGRYATSVLQYADGKGEYSWDTHVMGSRLAFVRMLSKHGFYAVSDKTPPEGVRRLATDENIKILSHLIEQRVRALTLQAECARVAANVAGARMSEIQKKIDKNTAFIDEADALLGTYSTRVTRNGVTRLVSDQQEADVRVYEARTRSAIDRRAAEAVRKALGALRQTPATAAELEAARASASRDQ